MESSKELEERCYDISPEQPMLLLERCSAIVKDDPQSMTDRRVLRRGLTELNLHPLFREKLLESLLDYDSRRQNVEENTAAVLDYRNQLKPEMLSREKRGKLIRMLILTGNIPEAFSIVKEFGWSGAKEQELLELCSQMILKQLPESDDTLLKLSWELFTENQWDGAVLDYLCEQFNGTSEQMYRLLVQSEAEHVELYDLPERLLAQMMFSGETEYLDPVYDCYRSGKQVSDLVSRAYFTMKSCDYFLKNRPTTALVFTYLEDAVQETADKKRIPTIYLLALTLWYSQQEALTGKQKELAAAMVEELLEEGRIFAYFHQLGRHIPMPDSVMDQITIEYRGSREIRPQLKIRVLPGEEASHNAEFVKVYPGIYIHQHVLFEGEVLEYEVYENGTDGGKKMDEGRLSYDGSQTNSQLSRFAALNDMSRCLAEKDGQKLKEKMEKYMTDHAAMESLFTLT